MEGQGQTSTHPLASAHKQDLISFIHTMFAKLGDSNFLLWKQKITTAIRGYELEEYSEKDPVVPPKFTNEVDQIADKINRDYLAWQKQDNLLMSW